MSKQSIRLQDYVRNGRFWRTPDKRLVEYAVDKDCFGFVKLLLEMYPNVVSQEDLKKLSVEAYNVRKLKMSSVLKNSVQSLPQIRGLHLDPARRRISFNKVIEIINNMQQYGLNTLHLHLTDDQGIGLDLESVNFKDSGGWTIREQKQISKLCRELGIRVIPEIDIPGHSVALRSLLRGDRPLEVEEQMGLITKGLIDLEDLPTILRIFEELCERFRVTDFIHMGGDETRGASREFFATLVDRVCKWARKRGLRVVAWEDIFNKVTDLPRNMVIQKWKPRTFPPIAQGLERIGKSRVIYSVNYYLDMSPDPFTMYRKALIPDVLGYIACTWGELIGEENINNVLYPSIMLLGERWSSLDPSKPTEPIRLLEQYKSDMISAGLTRTWKRRQWTGFAKGDGSEQPRSTSSVTIHTKMTRRQDRYPIISELLIEMSIDMFRAMHEQRQISARRTEEYEHAMIDALAETDAKRQQGSIRELFAGIHRRPVKETKTILRRIQRTLEPEEQLLYKNGIRMVIRELLRT